MRRIVFPGIAIIGLTYTLARSSYGLFLPEIQESLELSETQAGVPAFFAYAAYCLALICSPMLIDRTGAYRCALLSGFAAISGMVGMALSPNLHILSASAFIAAVGSGLSSPALSQIVITNLPPGERDKGNSWINAGTSFGAMVSGPAALLFAGYWRSAYLCFSAIGLIVLLWSRRSLPGTALCPPADRVMDTKNIKHVFSGENLPLFLAAWIAGFASSVYWTFSRSFLTAEHGMGETESMFLWLAMGIAGIAGGTAGGCIERFGITATYRSVLLILSASIGLIVVPSPISLYGSALLFGASYIFLTGVFIAWAVQGFKQSPASGVSLAFLFLGIGQSLGSLAAGAIIERTSYSLCFLLFAGVGLCGLWVSPRLRFLNPVR